MLIRQIENFDTTTLQLKLEALKLLKTQIQIEMGDERAYAASGKVTDKYKIGKTLGKGAFAVVKIGTHLVTNKKYAIKILNLPLADAKSTKDSFSRAETLYEINLLCKLEHPNVIHFKEYFESDSTVHIITELLKGGEMLESLVERGTYTEEDARLVFSQLISAIDYIHSQKVVHRDLKLENLLLTEKGKLDRIKIVDFGLAKNTETDNMQTVCGSPQYVSPEVLLQKKGNLYGPEVDLWSAGVILFCMLGGYPPFYDDSEMEMFKQIKAAAFDFDEDVWEPISESAKDLIRGLLTVDPAKRITSKGCLAHPWVTAHKVGETDLMATTKYLRKLKIAATAVIGAVKMKSSSHK